MPVRSKSFLRKGSRQIYDPIASIQKHKFNPKDETQVKRSPNQRSHKKVEMTRKSDDLAKSVD